MQKKTIIRIIAASTLIITATGGFALGASAPYSLDSTQPFYGCVTGVNGNITKVSNTQKTCPKGMVPISWNYAGPQGPQGLAGEQGPQGEVGEQGPQGIPGASSPGTAAYIESPDDSTRYQIYSFNNANWVKIDGNVYQISGLTLGGSAINAGYIQMYTSDDCTGTPKLVRLVEEQVQSPAHLGPAVKDVVVNINGWLGKVTLSSSTVSSLHSWEYLGCRTQDIGAVYNEFLQHRTAKLSEYQLEQNKPWNFLLPRVYTIGCIVPTVLLDEFGNPLRTWWHPDPIGYRQMDNCVENNLFRTSPLGLDYLYLDTNYKVEIYDMNGVTVPDLTGWEYAIN